ncbi:putative secreted protein [Granulibacter bethesdensis CGDNIH1]|uniref:Secreted protein n=3 Tax=Granulibacter bethesdensis TaxID=364410 RepID=Q0BUL0_GRABC|nr:putative secreted protein [Granulibacter bethesdensis CGDNIH1]APH51287.1 putative secreted protein [Granulibacter bethesdensis]APH63981.1 putative secreted protein [Granulibacter bethesdensis]
MFMSTKPMRYVRSIPSLLLVTFLAACSAPGANGVHGSSPSSAERPTSANTVFATQLAGPSTFLVPMPTAVVILKPGDLNRNRSFCQAFTSRLPTAQAANAASVVAPNLILTRWLIQMPEVPADRATDCDFLTGTYDYARAARIISALKLTEGHLQGNGPFLLMVIPDNTGLHVVGLDGSSANPEDFNRYIDSWGNLLTQTQEQITRAPDQPGLIRSVFNLVSAIARTTVGAIGGLIQGTVSTF